MFLQLLTVSFCLSLSTYTVLLRKLSLSLLSLHPLLSLIEEIEEICVYNLIVSSFTFFSRGPYIYDIQEKCQIFVQNHPLPPFSVCRNEFELGESPPPTPPQPWTSNLKLLTTPYHHPLWYSCKKLEC